MNNLTSLKKKNEDLARELADSCMKYVDLTFTYKEIRNKAKFQKTVFRDYIMKCEPTLSESEAEEKINALMVSAKKPTQLVLPIQLEGNPKDE